MQHLELHAPALAKQQLSQIRPTPRHRTPVLPAHQAIELLGRKN